MSIIQNKDKPWESFINEMCSYLRSSGVKFTGKVDKHKEQINLGIERTTKDPILIDKQISEYLTSLGADFRHYVTACPNWNVFRHPISLISATENTLSIHYSSEVQYPR